MKTHEKSALLFRAYIPSPLHLECRQALCPEAGQAQLYHWIRKITTQKNLEGRLWISTSAFCNRIWVLACSKAEIQQVGYTYSGPFMCSKLNKTFLPWAFSLTPSNPDRHLLSASFGINPIHICKCGADSFSFSSSQHFLPWTLYFKQHFRTLFEWCKFGFFAARVMWLQLLLLWWAPLDFLNPPLWPAAVCRKSR